MIQQISVYDFRDAFHRMNRGNNFSYEGLGEIYEYLEECDPNIELDVIAICCDFSQCSLDEFLDAFDVADHEDQKQLKNATDEEKREAISDYIAHNGSWHTFVENDQEVIFSNF